MGVRGSSRTALFSILFVLFASCGCSADWLKANQTTTLLVDGSPQSGRKISDVLFGIFFEEINHAGAGGLWAELVSNRGFEAGGQNTPSNIDPWSVTGNETYITVQTDRSSCFSHYKIALHMEVLCDDKEQNPCPAGGVGIYNPGFWGMNIEEGKAYNLVLYVKSMGPISISVSLTSADGLQSLANAIIVLASSELSNWTKVELQLEAKGSNTNSRLQLTTTKNGAIWFDQVSLMPVDTYKGHGFRKELFSMLADLKPKFIRFPGGCFVEGECLEMPSGGQQPLDRGRRDLVILVMFGCIGLMMALDILSFFSFLKIRVPLLSGW